VMGQIEKHSKIAVGLRKSNQPGQPKGKPSGRVKEETGQFELPF
jgi:hypothetical protein